MPTNATTQGAEYEQLNVAIAQLTQMILLSAPHAPPPVVTRTAPTVPSSVVEVLFQVPTPTPSGAGPVCPRLHPRPLILDDGRQLSITESDVPDPPVVSFAENIPQLNRMWDNTSCHWQNKSPLVIQGVPIPIKHWPEIYRYWKEGQWQGTKGKWWEWKVSSICLFSALRAKFLLQIVIERWRETTPEEFWAQFSNENGMHNSWTRIVKQITAERIEEDEKTVKRARLEYGDSFDTTFTSRKGSRHFVLVDRAAIARRYRELSRT